MAHLYVNPQTDSLYLDITRGDRSAVDMAEIADGVFLYVDEAGSLVAIEVVDLSRRGGLQVDDLNAEPGTQRPAIFDQIEEMANRGPRTSKSRSKR